MESVPDESRVIVADKNIKNLHELQYRKLYIDRHWYSDVKTAIRNDITGPAPLPAVPAIPISGDFALSGTLSNNTAGYITCSFVKVEAYKPYALNGRIEDGL